MVPAPVSCLRGISFRIGDQYSSRRGEQRKGEEVGGGGGGGGGGYSNDV